MELKQHPDTTAKTEITYGSKKLSIETGRLAKQAAGSVVVSVGGTGVLVTAAFTPEPKEGQDFFP